MKIKNATKYKSVEKFELIEFPPLTVLIGLNGSGKSQFLDALNIQAIKCDLFGDIETMLTYASGYAQHPQISLLKSGLDNASADFGKSVTTGIGARFGIYSPDRPGHQHWYYDFDLVRSSILQNVKEKLDVLIDQENKKIYNENEDPWKIGHTNLAERAKIGESDDNYGIIAELFIEAENALHQPIYPDPAHSQFYTEIAQASVDLGIKRILVDEVKVRALRSRHVSNMFEPGIASAMSLYRDRVVENDLDELQNRRDTITNYLSREEFIKLYGSPPWEIITDLLKDMLLPFEVIPPSPDLSHPVSFRLRSNQGGDPLTFEDISSGEQVLTRFAISIMRPKPTVAGIQRPLLLLLDEMDASLHPEMVQRWLSAISGTIVDELGIHVILTTHSPTTVAIAPEKSIFSMESGVPTIISKQDAINKLTYGVPTLSIDYSGRVQVFCESDTDAACYEKLYSAIRLNLTSKKELNFIGTGIRDKKKVITVGSGDEINAGEAVVREIVNNVTACGARSIYGIVDWDGKAMPNDKIVVMGQGSYYTLENILLDPVLLGLIMISDRISIPGIDLSPRSIGALVESDLQKIADHIQNIVKLPQDDGSTHEVEYLGGFKVHIKSRFASMNGHDLEEVISSYFPGLQRYTRNRGVLTKRISSILIAEYPEFCPKTIHDGFCEILGAQ